MLFSGIFNFTVGILVVKDYFGQLCKWAENRYFIQPDKQNWPPSAVHEGGLETPDWSWGPRVDLFIERNGDEVIISWAGVYNLFIG